MNGAKDTLRTLIYQDANKGPIVPVWISQGARRWTEERNPRVGFNHPPRATHEIHKLVEINNLPGFYPNTTPFSIQADERKSLVMRKHYYSQDIKAGASFLDWERYSALGQEVHNQAFDFQHQTKPHRDNGDREAQGRHGLLQLQGYPYKVHRD
ncbi:hypothetical protein PENSPDRAFT_667717 [Peniophora sp. CONT]|nr:hypothetical protein PENSPDRAFT_667717 [Peniophora sp. CONT]